uniref:probable E3 ubiquitin-protein ligase RHY1A n=1 Tax=Erigeron canadensis TaxID=72917 RepID=UPI001CB8DE99|nr:probable E3 ubiquitin-protein ligase RHY1A [Erigeron canadensis]
MPSASKLFNSTSRRIAFGSRNDHDFTPPTASSDSVLPDRRTTTDRRHHHRQDLPGFHPQRFHRHRFSEQGGSQPLSGSIINSEDFRSIRRWGANENDRLPGVVLLARERLLERLRGVHVSQNRQSNSPSSNIHQEDFTYNSFFETNNNLLEELGSESWQTVIPMSSMTRMLPRGLSEHELNQLSRMVFNDIEDNKETSNASRECSICLEGFEDGNELINLRCMHRFHSWCLFPWVEICGACPNCRKDIVVTTE